MTFSIDHRPTLAPCPMWAEPCPMCVQCSDAPKPAEFRGVSNVSNVSNINKKISGKPYKPWAGTLWKTGPKPPQNPARKFFVPKYIGHIGHIGHGLDSKAFFEFADIGHGAPDTGHIGHGVGFIAGSAT